MGIEPTRTARPELENKQFGAITNAKCEGRVNLCGMWGHVRQRRDTSVSEVAGSSLLAHATRGRMLVWLHDATPGPLTRAVLSPVRRARLKGLVTPHTPQVKSCRP
jgi:hypothetical protein